MPESNICNLLLVREVFTSFSTGGKLYINGNFFCYTLEDIVRPPLVKIRDMTAIPAGYYNIKITMSEHFKRETAELLNVPLFEGIRMHGGNTSQDTEGCVLVAYNRKGNDYIFNSAETDLTALLKKQMVPITIGIFNNRKI
jgi:hypothetical protein